MGGTVDPPPCRFRKASPSGSYPSAMTQTTQGPRAAQRPMIVIPAWNEAEAITDTIRDVRRRLPGVAVLVVDDGSTDGTAALARGAGASVLPLAFNLGVGGAMRAGYRQARASGHDAVVQVDADGQHDAADIERLLDGLDTADLVIGARFAGTGDYEVGLARRIAMRLLARVLSRLSGVTLTDTTSGFRAVGPRALALFADDYPVEYLGDTVESLTRAVRVGLDVAQVPVAMHPRQGGQPSQSAPRAVLYLARAMFVLVLALLRPPTAAS